MAKPTERAVKRKPMAVVLWSFKKAETDQDAGDKDFEWFETDENRIDYTESSIAWNVNDVQDHGDLVHLVAEIVDTTTDPMTLGRVEATPASDKGLREWVKKIKADPKVLLIETNIVSSAGIKVRAKKASPAAKKMQGGRTASTPTVRAKPGTAKKATDVAKKATPTQTPKPAARKAAAKKAVTTASSKPVAGESTGNGNARKTAPTKAAQLKARLAAKKAAEQATAGK